MIPVSGQYVKLIFRNSTQVEGFVEEWLENSAVLKSEDGGSLLLVMNLEQDVMAIKIVLEPQTQTTIQSKLQDLQEEFDDVYEQPSNDDLRTKKLAQLRIAMNEQEKKIVSEKLKQHVPNSVSGVKYGNPFNKK